MSEKLKCRHPNCTYEWYPRDPTKLPLACPMCKSYKWNIKPQSFAAKADVLKT